MKPTSFKRHRLPPDVIRYAVWLYFRFTLSIRDVEELLSQRGIEAGCEAVRCWAIKFGSLIAANLRRRRSPPTRRWNLDEMVVRIDGRRMCLWRAVDDEGEVLDILVQKRRNKPAAVKLLRKLLKNQGIRDSNCTAAEDASFHAPGWTTSLDYQLTPGTLLYVTAGSAYTSGGFNGFQYPPSLYQPQYFTSEELGIKSDWEIWGIKARTNAAAYTGSFSNIQVLVNIQQTNALGGKTIAAITSNAASATAQGFEFEGTLLPMKGVELSPSVSYDFLKYDRFMSINPVTGVPVDLSGEPFPYFPKIKVSLTASYQFPFDEALGNIKASANYTWQGYQQFSNTPTDVDSFEPGYSLLGLRVDWTNIMGRPVDAAFFVTNATDTTYREELFSIYSSLGLGASEWALPRMFGFSLKYRLVQEVREGPPHHVKCFWRWPRQKLMHIWATLRFALHSEALPSV